MKLNCCSKSRKYLEEVNNGIFEICSNCNSIGEQLFDYSYYENISSKSKDSPFEEYKHMWQDIGGEG